MKKITLFLLLALLTPPALRAQEFLALNPDARTAGMGNATAAASSGPLTVYTNAAASLFSTGTFEIGASYAPWLRDLARGYDLTAVGGFVPLRQRHALAFGARFYRSPRYSSDYDADEAPFIPKDEFNQPLSGGTESFRPLDLSADVAYGYRINRWLGISATARYVRSSFLDFYPADQAFGLDLAAYARIPLDRMAEGAWFGTGLKIADIDVTFGDADCLLPTRINLGGTLFAPIRDSHWLEATLDLGYRIWPEELRPSAFEAAFGAEYTLMQLFSLRAGYHVSSDTAYNYATVGAGVRFLHIAADFSYLLAGRKCPWRNTWQVGIGLYF
ncbi:MAG: PorV/PorQ family protein [Alistipes sp.]|nr:PorV/PorQ family protein [Alistipes sp.]